MLDYEGPPLHFYNILSISSTEVPIAALTLACQFIAREFLVFKVSPEDSVLFTEFDPAIIDHACGFNPTLEYRVQQVVAPNLSEAVEHVTGGRRYGLVSHGN
jgi:hypothetical protein